MTLSKLATSDSISGFVNTLLISRYDSPVAVADFHKEIWNIATSGARRIGIAAPRAHAKSTAVTLTLVLYLFLFRIRQYGLIVSDTESQASQFLGEIKTELTENAELIELFGVRKLSKDAITDIVVEFDDGHQFRIQALGAEQKVRGRKWRNKRPDFIVCDDLENDEMVESDLRREKTRNWFYKALVPCLSKNGVILVVGTILHMDSILMRVMKNKSWTTKLYKAHDEFDNFDNILWPEQWPEEALRIKRQEYIDEGFSEGYAQEYLNDPTAHSEAYFKREDFKDFEKGMREIPTNNYAAVDLAISDADKAGYTVITVGGMDEYRRLIIKQVVRFRGDSNDIINALFEVQKLYNIQFWKIEEGQIKRTLMGELYNRMNESGVCLNIPSGAVPTRDKRSRARAIQARMRAGGVYFDRDAEWFPAFEQELLQFPKGAYKDQVDSFAWLGIAINELMEGPTKKQIQEEDYIEDMRHFDNDYSDSGRSMITGY